MIEIWKKCINHNDRYYVSNLGRVKGPSGKISTGSVKKPYNYCRITMYKSSKKRKDIYVHILVMHYFNKPRPKGLDIHHIDNNPKNNNINNLKYVTHRENILYQKKIRQDLIHLSHNEKQDIFKKEYNFKNRIICICGGISGKKNSRLFNHLKTKKHKKCMNNIKDEIKKKRQQAFI